MILSAEQAQAVVGCVPCDQWPGSTYPCKCAENGDAARFIPAATADTWPVAEWIEVRESIEGSVCTARVGRVRLGEPVPVIDTDPGCPLPHNPSRSYQPVTTDHIEQSLFDGPDDQNDANRDPRLMRQLVCVARVLLRHSDNWMTLTDISEHARIPGQKRVPEASVSARIRDLRKPRMGGYTIDRKHVGNGLYAYRIVPHSGNWQLVLNPEPEPRSRKAEARKTVEAWIDWAVEHAKLHPDTMIVSNPGGTITLRDLQDLAR